MPQIFFFSRELCPMRELVVAFTNGILDTQQGQEPDKNWEQVASTAHCVYTELSSLPHCTVTIKLNEKNDQYHILI